MKRELSSVAVVVVVLGVVHKGHMLPGSKGETTITSVFQEKRVQGTRKSLVAANLDPLKLPKRNMPGLACLTKRHLAEINLSRLPLTDLDR